MTDSSAIPERIVPGTLSWDLFNFEHRQRYEFFASTCVGKRVLDVACGVGYGGEILLSSGARSVVGADIDLGAVGMARNLFGTNGLLLANTDGQSSAFRDGSFDVVVSFETVEHVPEPRLLFEEIKRILVPGGVFVCSSPNRDFAGDHPQNPYHLSEMSFQDFEDLFSQHFKLERAYSQAHSEEYLRHVDLLEAIAGMNRTLRFSLALRIENALRRLLGRQILETDALDPLLSRFVAGDMLIEELELPSSKHPTFILVGRRST